MTILRENTKRMSDMIDRLLTISRLESGNLPLQKQEVSLEEITRGTIAKSAKIRGKLPAHHIALAAFLIFRISRSSIPT